MKLKREGAYCVVLQVLLGGVGIRMKNCLRNGHLETCHGGNFLLYGKLLGISEVSSMRTPSSHMTGESHYKFN